MIPDLTAEPVFIDTHCHLASPELREQWSTLLSNAAEHGVQGVVNVAYDWVTTLSALEQCHQYQGPVTFVSTAGIQPHDAHTFDVKACQDFRNLILNNPKIVAIGEIGLDYYYDKSPRDKQQECFSYFLDLACELCYPVIIHVRNSFDDVFSALASRRNKGLTGVIHCFTGNLTEAIAFLNLGFFISFSGIVTFKNAKDLLAIAAHQVPLDRLLIETDSPYLAPVPHRGRINEPAWVTCVGAAIAQARGLTLPELAHITTQNARQLFARAEFQ